LYDEAIVLGAEKVRAAVENLSPTQEKVDLAVPTAVKFSKPSGVILFGSWPLHQTLRRSLDEVTMTIDLARLYQPDFTSLGG
jgi:hypothetical protein